MQKAIIYCRVSSQEQVEDGNSLKTQQRLCRQYAKNNDIDIVEVFIEEGESAKTINRRKLQEMMKYCKLQKDDIEILLIYKIDRLSRETYDYSTLKAFFSSCGIRIVSISEPIEDSPVGRFLENNLASIAQLDNEIRAERSRNGIIDALNEGRYVFRPAFGYIKVGTRKTANIKPNKTLARILKKLFRTIDKRYHSLEEVRKNLNTDLKKIEVKPVTKSHFYKIIRNPIYKGYIDIPTLGVHQKGTFKPIISAPIFDRVQSILSSKSKKLPIYKKNNPDFPLRGTVKHKCDKYMTANWSKGRLKKYPYYRCTHCKGVNINKYKLEEDFQNFLQHISLRKGLTDVIKKSIELNWTERNKELSKKIRILEIEKQENIRSQRVVVEKNIKGVLNDRITKDMITDLEKKDAEIDLELSKYQKPEDNIQDLLEYSTIFLTQMPKVWSKTDYDVKKRFQ